MLHEGNMLMLPLWSTLLVKLAMLCRVPEGLTLKIEKVGAKVVLHHDGYLY
jgi:hypothetical protein